MAIHHLKHDILSKLKAHVYINSFENGIAELIQNSIDANSSSVVVELDFMNWEFSVKDDGIGMSPEDLSAYGLCNYTSKLRSIEDLSGLQTFGFRGEAVSALGHISEIAVVSKFEGKEYKKKGDLVMESKDLMLTSMSGTIVKVKQFWRGLPVRKKIAQSEPTFRHAERLRRFIYQSLILKPHTKLLVIENCADGSRHTIIESDIDSDIDFDTASLLMFKNVFGLENDLDVSKVSTSYMDYRVSGFIKVEPITAKCFQFVFVNGRLVYDQELYKELNKHFAKSGFYKTSNTKNVSKNFSNHAVYSIFVKCIPGTSDLIQDQSKCLIDTSHLTELKPILFQIINAFLKKRTLKGSTREKEIENSSDSRDSLKTANFIVGNLSDKEFINDTPILSQSPNSKRHKKDLDPFTTFKKITFDEKLSKYFLDHDITDFKLSKECLDDCQVVNQVDNKFILLRLNYPTKILVIMDQHAADERVKLEYYISQFMRMVILGSTDLSATLSKTVCLNFGNSDISAFLHYKAELLGWGIVYDVQKNSICITSLPRILSEKFKGDISFLKKVLVQHIYDLEEKRKIPLLEKLKTGSDDWWNYFPCIPRFVIEILKSKACRSALMFGDAMSVKDCKDLIQEIKKCKLPFQCAHGRPSIIPLIEL